jgi:hypothetical protein
MGWGVNMIDVKMSGQDDLRRLSKQLRTVGDGKAVRRDMMRGLRQGAKPAAAAVKAAALSLPDKSGNASTGLRRRMAAATGVQVRTSGRQAGVKIRVSRRRMGGQASLAKVTNHGTWRHPVFASSNQTRSEWTWVRQSSRRGWFDRTAAAHGKDVESALKNVLNDIERKLSHR